MKSIKFCRIKIRDKIMISMDLKVLNNIKKILISTLGDLEVDLASKEQNTFQKFFGGRDLFADFANLFGFSS